MYVETVKVVADNEQGFIIINKSDLKEDQELYTEKPKRTRQKPELTTERENNHD